MSREECPWERVIDVSEGPGHVYSFGSEWLRR